jgi:hypothetical protein
LGFRIQYSACMKKKCRKCQKTKDILKFTRKHTSPDGYAARCKDCTRAVVNEHYKKNKKRYLEKAKKWNKEKRDWFQGLKEDLECSECGEDHPACIEFHHRDPRKKDFTVANFKNLGYSKARILKEIKKCNVLCANCHRKKHW